MKLKMLNRTLDTIEKSLAKKNATFSKLTQEITELTRVRNNLRAILFPNSNKQEEVNQVPKVLGPQADIVKETEQQKPLGEAGIGVLHILRVSRSFRVPDLERLMNEPSRAYAWITAWKSKGWIATISYGVYTINAKFAQENPVNETIAQ